MFSRFKNLLRPHFVNARGWRTRRKIVVIESDDWGCIRMPSREVYETLKSSGLPVEKSVYNRYDSLETDDDLNQLYEALTLVKDSNGKHPVLTANFIVANPDFEAIRQSDYATYYPETIHETLKRYPASSHILELHRRAMTAALMEPQLHGRDHVNVTRWMRDLKAGNPVLRKIFDLNMFTVHSNPRASGRQEYLDAFGSAMTGSDHQYHETTVAEAVHYFENIFGHQPKSFIAPCYTWHPDLEPILYKHGIRYLQSALNQIVPVDDVTLATRAQRHYLGEIRSSLCFTVRNCDFEPAETGPSSVLNCLNQMQTAFRWHKPAIISAHRVNFMSNIDAGNRERNLKMLNQLLASIVTRWPDVEFMGSGALATIIESDVRNSRVR